MPAASLGTLKSGVASRPSTAKRGTVDSVAPEPHCLDLPDVLQSRLPRDGGLSTTTPSEAFRGRIRIDGMPCGRSSSSQRQDMLFSASFPFFACVRGRRTSRRSETAYSYQTPKKDHSRTEQRLPLPPGNARQRPPGNLPRPAVAITASRSTRRRPARRMKYGTPI